MTPLPAGGTVRRLLRVLPGGSSAPAVAETDTGERIVLKLAGAGPGARALLAELVAAPILASFGLPVPATRAVWVPADLPWEVGTDEFDAVLRRSAGWGLGIAWLEGARDLRAEEARVLPPAFLGALRAADRLLVNMDRRSANPNLLRDVDGQVWAIDHGACLILERIASGRGPTGFALPRGHLLGDLPLPEPETHALPDVAAVLAGVPETWLDELGVGRAALADGLAGWFAAFRAVAVAGPG